jgi:hypothetical protein
MTTTDCIHCDELTSVIESAHEHALRALAETEWPDLDAVSWLAAHLAAVETVVEPLLRRWAASSPAELRHQHRLDRRLQRELRVLEQALAGDYLAAGANVAQCRERVIASLTLHAAHERQLVLRLARALGAEMTADAASRYDTALASAPTRPHPHLPHTFPLVSGVMWRAAGARDHVLDVMDGRHNPLPRPRRPHATQGRWTHYLLGTPLRDPRDGHETR